MNKHIENNLNHYIKEIDNPEYAILLSGKWGSGKTYFIKNYIDKSKSDKVIYIKVSLFGISNINEIKRNLITQLIEIDDSKKVLVNIGSKFIDKALKKLGVSIYDIPIDTIVKKFKNEYIFIFDDLERSNIDLSEVLGYINYLVEQSKFKVIILANEDEINNKDDFDRFKEKVIGKTFEVKQDLDATFDTFIEMVDSSKEVLEKNKALIKDIFIKANYNNLRHIRQTILDFEYFYNQLDDKFQGHNEIIKNLIQEFFIFSIEIKSGKLNSENFEGRYSKSFERYKNVR